VCSSDLKAPATKNRKTTDRRATRRVHIWPVLTEQEQTKAIADARVFADDILKRSGFAATPYESAHYILYTRSGATTGRRLLRSLENMHKTLKKLFEIPKETVLYHGKCAVFVLDSHQEFVDFEDRVFQNDAEKFGAFYHSSRTFSTIVASAKSPTKLEATLVHETTHGFMHRYKSEARLPTWANEGLADFMAAALVPSAQRGPQHWTIARTYVMNGKDPADIMEQNYSDGSWPDDNSYPVSHMLVRYMIKYKGPEFRAWIDDIKDGVNWVQAMADRFSPSPNKIVSPDILAQGFVAQMKSERTYTQN